MSIIRCVYVCVRGACVLCVVCVCVKERESGGTENIVHLVFFNNWVFSLKVNIFGDVRAKIVHTS